MLVINLCKSCFPSKNSTIDLIFGKRLGLNITFHLCRCSDEKNPRVKPYLFSSQKLKDLGMEFTPVKQSLYDTVKNLQDNGHLPVLPKQENSY